MNTVRVDKSWYTYILQSNKDGNYHTGCTGDLRKRFDMHQSDKNISNKHRRPWRLIYYEMCLPETDAFSREEYLKTGMGKRYIQNRLKSFLTLTV